LWGFFRRAGPNQGGAGKAVALGLSAGLFPFQTGTAGLTHQDLGFGSQQDPAWPGALWRACSSKTKRARRLFGGWGGDRITREFHKARHLDFHFGLGGGKKPSLPGKRPGWGSKLFGRCRGGTAFFFQGRGIVRGVRAQGGLRLWARGASHPPRIFCGSFFQGFRPGRAGEKGQVCQGAAGGDFLRGGWP